MRKFIWVFMLPLLLMLIACQDNSNERIKLNNDPLLIATFNAKQIESLQSIVAYVDDRLVSKTNSENIEEAYHEYFDSLNNSLKKNIVWHAPFTDVEKYQFLKTVDQDVYNSIWCWIKNGEGICDEKLTEIDQIKDSQLNISGLYMDYLSQLGEKDSRYKDLHDFILSSGGAIGLGAFIFVHEGFNSGIVKNRLWAAIYLLTLHDIDVEQQGDLEKN